ncbi:Regulatory protein recX [Paramagnetospirillum magnetotacticum MS-1]|uniref:Regulatory protein RecX n=2 Tax=Paramagnetospirillum magnetotacticum TaxID=188 RepID=A0A0C2YU34_PARME|nr:Regulatory protein recX [Paramagnetospirillum magnetotacticum MS-1]
MTDPISETSRRPPPKITPAYIENAALHYLERYSSSRANLRRVLMRKVDRSLAHWGGERDEAMSLVEAVIGKLAGLGYLDDAAYAEIKVRGLRRKGASTRLICATLAAKGVEAETTAAALSEQDGDAEMNAALTLARRRRIGPFRAQDKRAEFRAKDLATLGRAGFSWEIARAVVESDPEIGG